MDRVEPTGGHFFFITIITKLSKKKNITPATYAVKQNIHKLVFQLSYKQNIHKLIS